MARVTLRQLLQRGLLEPVLTARVGLRVGRQTGILSALQPRGLVTAAKDALRTRSVPSWFRFHAANTPHRTALVHGKRRWSYFELDETIEQVARGLRRAGIGPGDRVLLLCKNTPELIWSQAAAARLGASAVCASWRSTGREIDYLLDDSGARAVVLDASLMGAVEPLLPRAQLGDRIYVVGDDTTRLTPFSALLEPAPDGERPLADATGDAAVVIYTSGTTGRPKGAVRRFDTGSAYPVLSFFDRTPLAMGQTHLTVCPLYHSTAFGFTTLAFVLGSQVVLLEGGFDEARFFEAVARYRVAHTAVVPTMLQRLVTHAATHGDADRRSLRAIFSGGAPLSGPLARRVIETFGPVLYNFYGATETGLVSLADADDLLAAPGTIGRALPGNEIRLLGEDGREVADGEVGELYVRSGNLVTGYHRDPDATAASMRDGFFSVGDLARCDAQGYLFLEGRRRDMIISGGVNVYPPEVEAVLVEHPAVTEVAVVGIEDPDWGERVHAFVVRSGDVSVDELLAHARASLAGPKRPRGITFVEKMPRNPTGKILKRELRAML